jgi:hypothetical protein
MKERTTLQVERKTLKKLVKLKKYPRETNNEVLIRLIKKEINSVKSEPVKKEELNPSQEGDVLNNSEK